jgi:hypothetical protein
MSEQLNNLVERMTRQVAQRSGQRLSEVRPLIRELIAAAWDEYREDGARFGDTAEGFVMWLEERRPPALTA